MSKKKPFSLKRTGITYEVVFGEEVFHTVRGVRPDQAEDILDSMNKAYKKGRKDAKKEER